MRLRAMSSALAHSPDALQCGLELGLGRFGLGQTFAVFLDHLPREPGRTKSGLLPFLQA